MIGFNKILLADFFWLIANLFYWFTISEKSLTCEGESAPLLVIVPVFVLVLLFAKKMLVVPLGLLL